MEGNWLRNCRLQTVTTLFFCAEEASYALAIVITDMTITEEVTIRADHTMCVYAFDVLCHRLSVSANGKRRSLSSSLQSIPDVDGVGVFVTWNQGSSTRVDGKGWSLRGCIGTLSPTSLREGLRTYAVYSAFHDSRFAPVTAKDLSSLQVVVSILSEFKAASGGVYDWTVGVHGIVLKFAVGSGSAKEYTATYLPEVCAEQGWTKEECIHSLMRKSGYRGRITPAILESAELTTYTSTKAALSYSDYLTNCASQV